MLLSGGVDSCVAMHLLLAAGHEVVAFYLQIWFEEDFRNSWASCPWEEDLSFARQSCAQAGVELRSLPLTQPYWRRVVSACVGELAAGRTPNPDVLCNARVKYGAFVEALDAQHERFDRVASGHYARLHEGRLFACADATKDQTYFLAALSPAQLSRALFPLSHVTKTQVRQLASVAGLPPASRRDSQGLCFLGRVKFSEFVASHVGTRTGGVFDADTGARLGDHSGAWLFTLGQRSGLRLSGGPWFVAHRDVARNAVYVTRTYREEGAPRRNAFRVGAFSWAGAERPRQGPGARLRVKVRHGPGTYACVLQWETPAQAAAGAASAVEADDALAARARLPPHPHRHPLVNAAGEVAHPAPPPPPGLSARVQLDGNDQGLAVRAFHAEQITHNSPRVAGAIRGVLRRARALPWMWSYLGRQRRGLISFF